MSSLNDNASQPSNPYCLYPSMNPVSIWCSGASPKCFCTVLYMFLHWNYSVHLPWILSERFADPHSPPHQLCCCYHLHFHDVEASNYLDVLFHEYMHARFTENSKLLTDPDSISYYDPRIPIYIPHCRIQDRGYKNPKPSCLPLTNLKPPHTFS